MFEKPIDIVTLGWVCCRGCMGAYVHAAQLPKGLLRLTYPALYERHHTGVKLSLTCQ